MTPFEDFEADLCLAVAGVLAANGYHPSDCNESEGWTPEMAAEFAALLKRQCAEIVLPEQAQ